MLLAPAHMQISMIATMDKNRLIGRNGKLPWHLPADLKYFREMTRNKVVIMGRKTFASISSHLPGRRNIVLSRQKHENPADSSYEYMDFESALSAIKAENNGEVFIIGGSEIYSLFLPLATKLYLTLVMDVFVGDCYFPQFDHSEWEVVSLENYEADELNPYSYQRQILVRKMYS